MGLNYIIQYKKGAKNKVVDALSRHVDRESEVELQAVVTMVTPSWLTEVL